MRRVLSTLAVSLGILALLVPGIAAAEPEFLITDVTGDANGINSQGLGDLVTDLPRDQQTPADVAEYDILGVRYLTLVDITEVDGEPVETIVGVEARMAMGGQPTATSVPAIVRLTQDVGGCAIFLQYYAGTNGDDTHDTGDLRITCEGDLTGGNPPNITEGDALEVSFDEETNEIVWAFTFGTGSAADRYLKANSTISPTNPHVRVNTGPATAPVIDETYNTEFAFFKVGSDRS